MLCCDWVTREVKLNQGETYRWNGKCFFCLDDTNAHPLMKTNRLHSSIRSLVCIAATVLVEEFNNPNLLVL